MTMYIPVGIDCTVYYCTCESYLQIIKFKGNLK